jgi:hypothetical protein
VYSSVEEGIGKGNIYPVTVQPTQHQVCVTFGSKDRAETFTVGSTAHVRNGHQDNGNTTNSNVSTSVLVSQTEWDAAQRCVRLVTEQSDLNRRQLAADLSKSITKLVESTSSWTDGEDHMQKSHPLSHDGENSQRHSNSLESRQERRKRRRDSYYEATDHVSRTTISHAERLSDRYNKQYNERWADNRDEPGVSRQHHFPRMPDLPTMEQLNAPCYLHAYIDPKDNIKKASHLLKDCRQFLEIQKLCEALRSSPDAQAHSTKQGADTPNQPLELQSQQNHPRLPAEAFPIPRGQVNMIHKAGISKRESKKFTREVKLAEVAMTSVP